MNGWRRCETHTHTHTHTHTLEYYTAIKKWNLSIHDNIDGSRGYFAKWNKSDRERPIPYGLTYMWNLN